jgi:hypothetical protein
VKRGKETANVVAGQLANGKRATRVIGRSSETCQVREVALVVCDGASGETSLKP